MINNLPVLLVAIGLLFSPTLALVRSIRVAWIICVGAQLLTLAVAAYLAVLIWPDQSILYKVGGWSGPWGIELKIDALSLLVVLMVATVSPIILGSAYQALRHEIPEHQQIAYLACYLVCFSALIGIAVTADAFNVFVFYEISSLSTYGLMAMSKQRSALLATFRYLVMGTIGATFILIAIGLMYQITGTLNMADLADRLPPLRESRVLQGSLAFFVIGVGIKAAMWPLHYWLPNGYTRAPSLSTAFIGATSTKVSMYVMIRFIYDIYGEQWVLSELDWQWPLAAFAVTGILFCSIIATFRNNLKRLLAYSSVAQMGYILLAISLGSSAGLSAGILHLLHHGLMKGALFLAVVGISLRAPTLDIKDLAGIGKLMPWTVAGFCAAALSLLGVPTTVGFISKWHIVVALLDSQWWWAVAVVIASSLIATVYVWKVVEYAWLRETNDHQLLAGVKEAPLPLLFGLWLLVGLNFYFGIDTRLTLGFAQSAADMLTGAPM